MWISFWGAGHSPVVEAAEVIAYPKGFSEPEILKWLHQEIAQIFGKHDCNNVAIKKPELGVLRSNSLDIRIECEGVVTLAAAEAGCLSVKRLFNSSIAKGLGLKGKGKYLKTLDTSPVNNFNTYPPKVQEAIRTGWSGM
jgi:hypothetical protein